MLVQLFCVSLCVCVVVPNDTQSIGTLSVSEIARTTLPMSSSLILKGNERVISLTLSHCVFSVQSISS